MPRSKLKPKDTFEAFHQDISIRDLSQELGITRETIKRWWLAEFGEAALAKRLKRKPTPRPKMSDEERREKRRIYNQNNAERIREQGRALRNKPEKKAARKAYREAHRDEIRAFWREYYAINGARIKERVRARRAEDLPKAREKDLTYARTFPEKALLKAARTRAHAKGVTFDITAEDVRACIPSDGCCPITREPFQRNEGSRGAGPQSMSLDRIIPHLGYVRGNIAVISYLANAMKSNCTDPEVFRRLADFLENHLSGQDTDGGTECP